MDRAEGLDLFHIHIFQTGELAEHTPGGIVGTLVVLDKSAHHGPFVLLRLKFPLGEEKTELPLHQAENYTVDSYVEPWIFAIESHRFTRSRYRMLQ